jgi:hypothetical protein
LTTAVIIVAIAATAVITGSIGIIAPVVSATPIPVTTTATAAAAKVFVLPSATPTSWEFIALKILIAVLDKGSIAEFELSARNIIQFCANRIIVHQLFVPVAVSQLHIISNRMGKTCFLFWIFLLQCFMDYHFQISA